MATPNFGFPHIAGAQAQKHVTHNAALDLVDAALPQVAVSATTTAAPPAPAIGAAFIVPGGASGFGLAAPDDVAIWDGTGWHIATPAIGWRWFVADMGHEVIYTPAGWRSGSVAGATGASMGLAVLDAVVTLTGASTTAPGLIPARAILLGVTSWNVTATTGAASYSVGDGSDPARFGGALSGAQGAFNRGVIGPTATYAPADVIVTAEGGSFTGGQVGLAALVIAPGVPV